MKCKLCGVGAKKIYLLKGIRASHGIAVNYCKACSIHFCDAIDYDYETTGEDIVQYYENSREYIEMRQHKIFNFIGVNFYRQPGIFLDIGSGVGYSLKIAQALGWQAVGVEPSVVLEEHSRTTLKLNTINGYLSKNIIATIQAKLPFGYADYILVDNVLEHIPEPLEFFQNSLSLLKPGGLLLVIIPPVDWLRLALAAVPFIRKNATSAQINLFYDPEQHVNYFSRKAIRVLTDKAGGCKLTNFRFHHSKLLNGWLPRAMGFETGYYFIVKDAT